MPSAIPKVGVNDLQSQFPEIAAEAYGWDPLTVTKGSDKKRKWQCGVGHIWDSSVSHRTVNSSGCPFCSNSKVLPGFNDLKTRFPDIAEQAFGWDPSQVMPGNNKKFPWKCHLGHKWEAQASSRTSMGSSCPICSNNILLVGFNDLKTKFPAIAKDAHEWDPTTVIAGTPQKRKWKCKFNHTWDASVNERTSRGRGCPICAGQKLLVGFNDLQTKFPDIAAQAYGWDPKTVISGTSKIRQWKCILDHTWDASVNNRTSQDTGCPICAEYGFNSGKDAWFYLMQRPGEQQLGITNNLQFRINTHEKNGWVLLDHTNAAKGQKVLDTEKKFKKWLRKSVGLMKGTTENWATTSMEVQTLAELKERSGIETDLF